MAASADAALLGEDEFRRLAEFRGWLRDFHCFSERSARALGLTSLQYQALLAIKAQEHVGAVTMTALAEALLVKHNSAVGLVDRIGQLGLVVRRHPTSDRRRVVVELTQRGRRTVEVLARQHREELQRVSPQLARHAGQLAAPIAAPPPLQRLSAATERRPSRRGDALAPAPKAVARRPTRQ